MWRGNCEESQPSPPVLALGLVTCEGPVLDQSEFRDVLTVAIGLRETTAGYNSICSCQMVAIRGQGTQMGMLRDLLGVARSLAVVGIVLPLIYLIPVTAIHFPRDTGKWAGHELEEDSRKFYNDIYAGKAKVGAASEPGEVDDHPYVVFGQDASESGGVEASVARFIEEQDLHDARVLEVGAGSGQLQDMVEDYTGLDIAGSARRYFHKPFVEGSATDLPFPDNEFDSVWTIWTLEHVPDPQKALEELRRVVKPGGYLYVHPAWLCAPWGPAGYEVRPYSDFDWKGKLAKWSLNVRANGWFRLSYLFPIRMLRRLYWEWTQEPTVLRYTALTPNFQNYWVADSDAVASIDSYEGMLWFLSRGDECINCPEGFLESISLGHGPLIVRVNKPAVAG